MLLALVFIAPSIADDARAVAADEIVVEGEAGTSPDPLTTPASVTVIAVDERLPASADLATVVDSASGTTVKRLGGLGDWSGVSIRGSTFRQVQVHLDGVPLNPDGSEAVNLSELPLQAFSRVEIYRGNAPAELDAAPMGGVVNLVSSDEPEADVLSMSGGSLGTAHVFGALNYAAPLLARPTDGMAVVDIFSTRGDFVYFDDNATAYNLFDDRLRTRENNDKQRLNLHGRLRMGPVGRRLTLLDAAHLGRTGVPGTGVAPALDTRLDVVRNLAVLQAEGKGAATRGTARVYNQVRRTTWDDRGDEIGTGAQHDQDTTLMSGAMLFGAWAHDSRLGPSLALSLRHERYLGRDLLAGTTTDPRHRFTASATPAADAWLSGDAVRLSAAVQLLAVDNRALGDVPHDEFPAQALEQPPRVGAANPRGGILWRPAESLAFKANGGRYLRTPDITELYGDTGALIGNAGLQPERGWQTDLGTRYEGIAGAHRVQLDLGGFANASDDLITYVQNSQRTMVPVNLDRGLVYGIEIALSLDVSGLLESATNLTHSTSINRSSDPAYAGNQLPGVPAWELSQRTALHDGDRWRLGHGFSFTDGTYWDETNWYRSAPRPIHSLFARVDLGDHMPQAEIDVLNVADRIVQTVPRNPLDPTDEAIVVEPLSDFVGYPLPGRTVLLTLRWAG